MVLIVVLGLISSFVSVWVTIPLFALTKELEKVSRLDLDVCKLKPSQFNEVRRLHQSFRMMQAALSSFKRYVPLEVITNILSTQVINLINTAFN
jgi:hypothetical protein